MAGNWKEPEFDFSERSDRVTLKLEVGQVVYIPGAADIRNENTDQAELKSMSKEERILEYIRQNGNISTQKVIQDQLNTEFAKDSTKYIMRHRYKR